MILTNSDNYNRFYLVIFIGDEFFNHLIIQIPTHKQFDLPHA